jgi:general secretion pathway protein E
MELKPVSDDEFSQRLTLAYESDSSAAQAMAAGMEEDMDLEQLMGTMPKTEDLLESQDDAPIIRLLNALLSQAIKQHASDVHIETFEKNVSIRYRVDGVLREVLEVQRVLSSLLISRIKVMAKLDIAEKRVPQDGRISLRIAGHTVDVRVSTMPSNHGERIVLRLLDKKVAKLDLQILGMPQRNLSLIKKLIQHPHGIILITGPTGSGKTTSLYAMLSELNDKSRNILTVEDPIEFDLPGIGQTQVNAKVGMTFAKGLRAMLRQDPDVVMVGEIRDLETAEIAVQASLTGHLVLSTLHTNSAIGAITRLRDMGVEPFLLSSSLVGVIAQRLVRILCKDCKKAFPATGEEKELLKVPASADVKLFQPQGCDLCNNTGYWGRAGIYEIIPVDYELQRMIHNNCDELTMEKYARKVTPGIRQDGFEKVLAGQTSIAEVLRVALEGVD